MNGGRPERWPPFLLPGGPARGSSPPQRACKLGRIEDQVLSARPQRSPDQEERLEKLAGANVLHVRAGYFMANNLHAIPLVKAHGVYPGMIGPTAPIAMIATQDIAATVARELVTPSLQGQIVRNLLRQRDVTMSEAAQVLGAAVGKPGGRFPNTPSRSAGVDQGKKPVTRRVIRVYTPPKDCFEFGLCGSGAEGIIRWRVEERGGRRDDDASRSAERRKAEPPNGTIRLGAGGVIMKHFAWVMLAVVLLLTGPALPAEAGGSGGWHGGGARWTGGGAWHGGGARWTGGGTWRGGGWGWSGGTRVFIGGGWWGPGWWGPGWGPGWWGPGWGPGWWGAPTTPLVVQQPPQQFIQQGPPPQQQSFWYFCPNPQGYFPYIRECPTGWLQVVPQLSPPPQ